MELAEYTEFTCSFPTIAFQCLHKLPSSNNNSTYSCDHHSFNFLLHDGYAGDDEHMKYIIDHAEEIDKLAKVKAQVSEVKSVMMENIGKANDRVENLTILADKMQNLWDQAQAYRKQGTQIRRKLWCQNMKIKAGCSRDTVAAHLGDLDFSMPWV